MWCSFCPHSFYGEDVRGQNKFDREKGRITYQLWKRILRFAEEGCSELLLGFFGEPMMHSKFRQLIDMVPKNRPYKLTINTNWSFMTMDMIDVLNKFDHIRISMDAINSEIFERLCPGTPVRSWEGSASTDRYEEITDKIEKWLRIANHPQTSIVFVESEINADTKTDFIDKWRSYLTSKKDFILTKSVLSYGGAVKAGQKIEQNCSLKINPFFTVSWEGRLSPCNLDVNMAIDAGSIWDYETFADAISSVEWDRAVRSIKTTSKICENCGDANNWTANERHYRFASIKDRLHTEHGISDVLKTLIIE